MRLPDDDAQPRIAVDPMDRPEYDAALRDFYGPRYHDEKTAPARRAADRILPIVFSALNVASMVDVGCGPGSWLVAARDLGVQTVMGVEGDWAKHWYRGDRAIPDDVQIVYSNLEDALRLPRTFDLAICIEVIEHLSPARGPSFIADLCRCAPHVLLGAAIPGQKGPNHLNTRWPSYWSECFAEHGYRPLDFVRARVWGDEDLLIPVRQNPILFVREDVYEAVAQRVVALPAPPSAALDQVHPVLFAIQSRDLRNAEYPGLRDRIRLAAGIPGAAFRRFRERASR